jgi:hypothetical protein
VSILRTFTNIVLRIVGAAQIENFAVYEGNNKVLANAGFMNATVDDNATLMEHPLEDGSVITDHIVFNSNNIRVQVIIDDADKSSLEQLNRYYADSTLLSVKVKNQMFNNMVISGMPYEAQSSHFDKTVYQIIFKSVIFITSQYGAANIPKSPKNGATAKTGQKYTVKSTPKPSVLGALVNQFNR